MMRWWKAVHRRQDFFPGFLGVFLNPFYIARFGLLKSIKEFGPELSGNLIDIGCGTKPYRTLFDVKSYVGLDIDSTRTRRQGIADYFYEGKGFPLDDSVFDSALCSQVLEHVFNPDEFLSEINRVLKDGGRFLLTVPFVWDEHEQPYDYARYSSYGLRALLEKNQFNVIQHRKIGADASLIFQLSNAYLYKVTLGLPRSIRILSTVTVMALITILGLIAGKIFPDNPDLFLDQVILAEKIS